MSIENDNSESYSSVLLFYLSTNASSKSRFTVYLYNSSRPRRIILILIQERIALKKKEKTQRYYK